MHKIKSFLVQAVRELIPVVDHQPLQNQARIRPMPVGSQGDRRPAADTLPFFIPLKVRQVATGVETCVLAYNMPAVLSFLAPVVGQSLGPVIAKMVAGLVFAGKLGFLASAGLSCVYGFGLVIVAYAALRLSVKVAILMLHVFVDHLKNPCGRGGNKGSLGEKFLKYVFVGVLTSCLVVYISVIDCITLTNTITKVFENGFLWAQEGERVDIKVT